MDKIFAAIRKNYFDNTVELSKLSKTFFLWAIGLVLVYVTNIFLVRIIGLSLFGKFSVFISWVTLCSTIVAFGWDGYLIQKIPLLAKTKDGKISSSRILVIAVLSFFILFALLSIAMLLLSKYNTLLFAFIQPGQLKYFLVLVFLFAAIGLLKAFLKIFHIVIQVQWVEDFMKPILLFAIILFFYVESMKISLSTLYIINIIAFAILFATLLLFVFKTYKNNFVLPSVEVSSENEKWFTKCFYFMCIYLGYSIFTRMELLFLGHFNKNDEAAKFQILLRISELVIIPDFLFNYFLPQKFSYLFAEKKYDDARKLFGNASKTIIFLQLICFAGIMAIGYFYLQSFDIASPGLYILLVAMSISPVFYSLFGSANLVLKTSGLERYSFYALFIVLVAELVANYLFIQPFGLIAAVIISIASVLLYTLLLSLFLYNKLKFYNAVTKYLFFVKNAG